MVEDSSVDDPTLQPGADGEIPEGLSVEWPDKPKKKRPLSPLGRRARSLMRKALLVIPVATISIFLTLLMTHNIDLNALPVFRRACLATLGSTRIAFSTFKQSDSLYLADVDNSRICGLVYGRVDVTFWSPDRKYIVYSPSIFKNEIHLVDTQSGDQRLTVGPGAILAWSHTGATILYRTH